MKLQVPYFSEKTSITVRSDVVEVKPFQIIVWVSLTDNVESEWDSKVPAFPAILDIGNNHNFALTEKHLMRWAGIHVASLPDLGHLRLEGKRVSARKAAVWLHMDARPFQLNVLEGIAVHEGDWPRLPILGLRALTNSKLQTFVYGDTKQVVIRTPPPWYWPF